METTMSLEVRRRSGQELRPSESDHPLSRELKPLRAAVNAGQLTLLSVAHRALESSGKSLPCGLKWLL